MDYQFLEALDFNDLPDGVKDRAKLWLLDLIGVAASAEGVPLSQLIARHAAAHFGAGATPIKMIFDGRAVSAAGAALQGGMRIDAIDAHDGHRGCKGHVGCALLPGLLSFCQDQSLNGRPLSGAEFLTLFVLGYEIGTRAGEALHASAPDYHTSGAWMAVAVAAIGARALGLDRSQTRHAVGIAEYHGPRSQMMRCIDHPTMLKDGSGWGAMAGVSAAYLARDGFTGAPALTLEDANVASFWKDLGAEWRIHEQYWKPYPICRWAQPAVTAILALRTEHNLRSEAVSEIEIVSFHECLRLAARAPQTSEEAQYSTAYPVATALVRGTIKVSDVQEHAFSDPEIARLAGGMILREVERFNAVFPNERLCEVILHLKDGRRVTSGVTQALGDPETPPSDDQIKDKFRDFAAPVLGRSRARKIEECVERLAQSPNCQNLVDLLTAPVDPLTAAPAS